MGGGGSLAGAMGWDLNFVQLMHFNEKRARDVQPYKTAKHLQTRCCTLQFMAHPPHPPAQGPRCLPARPPVSLGCPGPAALRTMPSCSQNAFPQTQWIRALGETSQIARERRSGQCLRVRKRSDSSRHPGPQPRHVAGSRGRLSRRRVD